MVGSVSFAVWSVYIQLKLSQTFGIFSNKFQKVLKIENSYMVLIMLCLNDGAAHIVVLRSIEHILSIIPILIYNTMIRVSTVQALIIGSLEKWSVSIFPVIIFIPLHVGGICEYRNGFCQSISQSILQHSSMMARWGFLILGTIIRSHGPLMHVK